MEIYSRAFCDPAISVNLGDWREILGNEFSGTCSYFTEFSKPQAIKDAIILDLGRVDYSAEIFLNNESVGVLVMPPFRLTLPANIIKEKNLLEIRVTGSAANEYKYTKSFEKFAKWQLSPYYDKQVAFCEDNLSAGLFGPVKIYY